MVVLLDVVVSGQSFPFDNQAKKTSKAANEGRRRKLDTEKETVFRRPGVRDGNVEWDNPSSSSSSSSKKSSSSSTRAPSKPLSESLARVQVGGWEGGEESSSWL